MFDLICMLYSGGSVPAGVSPVDAVRIIFGSAEGVNKANSVIDI